MDKKVVDNNVAYQNDDGLIYALIPISPVAALIGFTDIPDSKKAKADFEEMFETSGFSKFILVIDEVDKYYVQAVRKLGFKQEGRLKKATPHGDLLVFGQYR